MILPLECNLFDVTIRTSTVTTYTYMHTASKPHVFISILSPFEGLIYIASLNKSQLISDSSYHSTIVSSIVMVKAADFQSSELLLIIKSESVFLPIKQFGTT